MVKKFRLELKYFIIIFIFCILADIGIIYLFYTNPTFINDGYYNIILPLLPFLFIYLAWLKYKDKI